MHCLEQLSFLLLLSSLSFAALELSLLLLYSSPSCYSTALPLATLQLSLLLLHSPIQFLWLLNLPKNISARLARFATLFF
jgi:hypothetical protein